MVARRDRRSDRHPLDRNVIVVDAIGGDTQRSIGVELRTECEATAPDAEGKGRRGAVAQACFKTGATWALCSSREERSCLPSHLRRLLTEGCRSGQVVRSALQDDAGHMRAVIGPG
jgi:hypothetical protein